MFSTLYWKHAYACKLTLEWLNYLFTTDQRLKKALRYIFVIDDLFPYRLEQDNWWRVNPQQEKFFYQNT